MKMNTGSFIADGNEVQVDVGFVPDLVIAIEGQEESTPQFHYWLRERIDSASGDAQFGILDSGGTKSKHAAAINGFAPLDEATNKIKLPAPSGNGEAVADPPNPYTVARSTAATARSTTALGTVLKPSLGKETGYVYECTTAGTGSAEPSVWPTVPGETITDGTVTYITREEKVFQGNVKGFTLGATGQTDSDEWTWIAFGADKVSTEVDAADKAAGSPV